MPRPLAALLRDLPLPGVEDFPTRLRLSPPPALIRFFASAFSFGRTAWLIAKASVGRKFLANYVLVVLDARASVGQDRRVTSAARRACRCICAAALLLSLAPPNS